MRAFESVGGGYEAYLEPHERAVITQLAIAVVEILTDQEDPFATLSAYSGWDPDASPVVEDAQTPNTQTLNTEPSGLGTQPAGRGELDEESEEILARLDFDPALDARNSVFRHPALERLIPPASRTDAEMAAEFRRYTQQDLRDEKASRLLLVLQELADPPEDSGTVFVGEDDVPVWLAAMTDMRLVLGTQLGVETEDDAERIHRIALGEQDSDQAIHLAAATYTALAWWQESLLQALVG